MSSIDVASEVNPENFIAIEISSFGNVNQLKKLNVVQKIMGVIEEELLVNNVNAKEISEKLRRMKIDVKLNEDHINSILKHFNGIKNFDLCVFEIFLNKNNEMIEIIKNIF